MFADTARVTNVRIIIIKSHGSLYLPRHLSNWYFYFIHVLLTATVNATHELVSGSLRYCHHLSLATAD